MNSNQALFTFFFFFVLLLKWELITPISTPYIGLNILKDLLEHSGKVTCKLDYCSVSGELFLLWEQVDY